MNRFVCTTVCLAFAPTVLGASPPPLYPMEVHSWPSTLKTAPGAGVNLGKFRIRFEDTTLDQVRNAASLGIVRHRGDASESIHWLCYTFAQRGVPFRLWFTSSEMSGGTAIDGVVAVRIGTSRPTLDCPSLPMELSPVSLDAPVWVGSSAGSVARLMGAPSHVQGVWRSYDFQSKVAGKCDGGYDFLSSLAIRLENGLVSEIHSNQTTSC